MYKFKINVYFSTKIREDLIRKYTKEESIIPFRFSPSAPEGYVLSSAKDKPFFTEETLSKLTEEEIKLLCVIVTGDEKYLQFNKDDLLPIAINFTVGSVVPHLGEFLEKGVNVDYTAFANTADYAYNNTGGDLTPHFLIYDPDDPLSKEDLLMYSNIISTLPIIIDIQVYDEEENLIDRLDNADLALGYYFIYDRNKIPRRVGYDSVVKAKPYAKELQEELDRVLPEVSEIPTDM